MPKAAITVSQLTYGAISIGLQDAPAGMIARRGCSPGKSEQDNGQIPSVDTPNGKRLPGSS